MSQMNTVRDLMADGQWRSLGTICKEIGFGTDASISARLRELRLPRYGAYVVNVRRNSNGSREYQMIARCNPWDGESITTKAPTPSPSDLSLDQITRFVGECMDDERRFQAVLAAINQRGVFIRG